MIRRRHDRISLNEPYHEPFMPSREFSFDLLDDATIEKLQEISARTGRTLEETILDAIDRAILREKNPNN
jgi:hypothetical protein